MSEQAAGVLARIVELCNTGERVAFEEDWGGNTLTVYIGNTHSHVGVPDGDLVLLIEQLHALLVNGRGLSFVAHVEEQEADDGTH